MNKIFLFNADSTITIKNKNAIKTFIVNLFKEEQSAFGKISYVFCSDEYLLKINNQYLNHDTLTDIITFPLSEPGVPIEGEIYISVDRVKENAKIYKVQYQTELLRVMIHGVLHLCGYKDKNKSDQLNMRRKENYYLNQFNVSREANT